MVRRHLGRRLAGGRGLAGRGKIGYVAAPVVETDSSGWLYAWAWSIQEASAKKDNAWKFISWASGKEYEELVGSQLGWSQVPAGKRASTYENPAYLAEASAFAEPTLRRSRAPTRTNPGVQPRPALGIQFVGIPEFPDLGTQVSQEVSSAIAGQTTVDEALERGQQLAQDAAEQLPGAGVGDRRAPARDHGRPSRDPVRAPAQQEKAAR